MFFQSFFLIFFPSAFCCLCFNALSSVFWLSFLLSAIPIVSPQIGNMVLGVPTSVWFPPPL